MRSTAYYAAVTLKAGYRLGTPDPHASVDETGETPSSEKQHGLHADLGRAEKAEDVSHSGGITAREPARDHPRTETGRIAELLQSGSRNAVDSAESGAKSVR